MRWRSTGCAKNTSKYFYNRNEWRLRLFLPGIAHFVYSEADFPERALI